MARMIWKLKPKWPWFTGLLGFAGVVMGLYWSHLEALDYARFKAIGAEIDGVNWRIFLTLWIGIAVLFFSIMKLVWPIISARKDK
jgi:hypothetical protein